MSRLIWSLMMPTAGFWGLLNGFSAKRTCALKMRTRGKSLFMLIIIRQSPAYFLIALLAFLAAKPWIRNWILDFIADFVRLANPDIAVVVTAVWRRKFLCLALVPA